MPTPSSVTVSVSIHNTGKRAYAQVFVNDACINEPELPLDVLNLAAKLLRGLDGEPTDFPYENSLTGERISVNEGGHWTYEQGARRISIPNYIIEAIGRIADGTDRINVAASREYEADREDRIRAIMDIELLDYHDSIHGVVVHTDGTPSIRTITKDDDDSDSIDYFTNEQAAALVERRHFGALHGDTPNLIHGEVAEELDDTLSGYAIMAWHEASVEAEL